MKPLWMAAAACAVLVSACSKSEPEAAPMAPGAPAAAQKTAAQKASAPTYPRVAIDTDAGLFWFEPRRCSIAQEPGNSEVSYSIEGAGQSPDGQPIYVTVQDEDNNPAQGPELRINVGTDQPRKTPEVVWIANDGSADSLRVPAAKTTVQGATLEVQRVVFTRSGSDRLTAQGPVRIDCTQR